MKNFKERWNAFLARLVTKPVVSLFFERALLGAGSTDWSKWYKQNGIYKFGIGDTICPGFTPSYGYGIDPEGLIVGHRSDGKYIVSMTKSHKNADGSWARMTTEEIHFKWNIEHHFKLLVKGQSVPVAAAA